MKGTNRKDYKNLYSVLRTLCSMLLAFFILLFAVSSGFAVQKNPRERLALFPFENFSEDKNALTSVIPVLRERLEAKGFEVLDEDTLNKFLLKERIRSTGYITKDIARKLKEEANVAVILLGSINSFVSGENPRVGLSARLINPLDGSIVWANHTSATGEDFTTILGLGRIITIDRLTYKVTDKLLETFRMLPLAKERESTYRIAILPFQNKSRLKDVGMIVTYMFLMELFRNKNFEPIEFGDVRSLLVDLRVKDKGEIDFKKTEAISSSSGVDGIIVGTVETYNEEEVTAPPEVSISARLIDTRKGRIMWSGRYQSKGDDNIFVFDWGRMRSAESVADRVVSKLLHEMNKAKWH